MVLRVRTSTNSAISSTDDETMSGTTTRFLASMPQMEERNDPVAVTVDDPGA